MANLLQKAIRTLVRIPSRSSNPARGTVSGFVPGISPLWGQPYPEQASGEAAGLISRQRMREIVLRTPTAAASVNAILDFSSGVKIGLRNVDAAKPVAKNQALKVSRIMSQPNANQTKRQFMLTLMRDIATFGYGAIEIVKTGDPDRPVDMWVMDAARLRIDFDEHGFIKGYDMLDAAGKPILSKPAKNSPYDFPSGMNMGVTNMRSVPQGQSADVAANPQAGTDLHGWEPGEVMLFSLHPISESVYPQSRIVQLFTTAVLEDLMMQFIADRFTDSNIPFGVFDLGDVTEIELKTAIDNWNTQGQQGNRILMTGSKGTGSKWIPFGYHLKDLEAVALLSELRGKIMGILGVTANELGESQDVNKSNGYNLSFTFKKRAVEPLLDEITDTLTRRLLWDTLGFTDVEFYYEEIDSRDDFLMSQIDDKYMKLGIFKPNEIRNRKGLTSEPGGDESLVFTGASYIPLDMLRTMAETMVQIEQQSTGGVSETGPEGADMARFRTQGSQPPGTQRSSDVGRSGSNGHQRGASSELARQLTGSK
jgi:hypothetical protein